jgi:hypothetical protein
MTAEFIHKGNTHRFEVDPADPPAFTVATSRACPKSPVIRYHLGFERIDEARQVALYDVLAFESE